MVVVLNNLIADLMLHIDQFPVQALDLQAVSFLEIGPGGACNVAIAARRLGLEVVVLGEVGTDPLGQMIVAGLQRENINTDLLHIGATSQTPAAAVLVDKASEPGYLGFGGKLQITTLPASWRIILAQADGLFVDGWAETTAVPDLLLAALQIVHDNAGTTFFDPGPGNPRIDNTWHQQAVALTDVLLLNAAEAERMSNHTDPQAAASVFLERGIKLVGIKLGDAGVLFADQHEQIRVAGLPVTAVDTTGAGDSVAGAVMAGYFAGLSLQALAQLANAAGAAKVQKRGTGHNVPAQWEIMAVLSAHSQIS